MLRTDPVRIFVSSPGDVVLERRLAEGVISRLQGTFGNQTPVEAIFWEHEPLVATTGPQEQLVRPSEVDIVVCILWSRFGTRLPKDFHRPDSSRYGSGTEFEFEDAAAGYRAHGWPALLVYRKTAEPFVSLRDEAYITKQEQYKSLSAFLSNWFYDSSDGTLKGALHHFEGPAEFETLLERHLYKLIEQCLPQRAPSTAAHRPTRTWRQGSPFRGLEFFDFQHAPIFSGRTRAIGDVVGALNRQAREQRSFVLITGMSGCGKSSLVRAGILPLLVQPGVIEGVASWRRAIFRPAESPGDLWSGLSTSLLGEDAFPELNGSGITGDWLASELKRDPRNISSVTTAGLLAASAIAGAENPVHFVLVVDPLEEVLVRERLDSTQVGNFIAVLDTLAQSGHALVIATLRSDFYQNCEQFPDLVALKSGAGTYHLLPPTSTEILQMIRQPAWAGGLQFEEKTTFERLDDVLRDAATGNEQALPLLEFTLEELYRHRTDENLLTFEAYNALGGLEGSIGQRAEEVYTSLPAVSQATLRNVFHALVGLGGAGELATRRQARLDQWDAESKLAIDRFVEARLFVTDQTEDEAVVSLAHEALLRHWPRLASWVEENREGLRARERVEAAAVRWEQEGRSLDLLLSQGKQLAEGVELLNSKEFRLGVLESEFVRYSLNRVESARRRRRFYLVAVFASLAVLLAFSFWQWRQAEGRALVIQENAIVARAEATSDMLATRPVDGLKLAVEVAGESLRRFGHLTQPVRNSLKSALDIARETNVLSGHGAPVHAVAFDPKGRWLVSVSADGSLCFWNRQGQIIRQLVSKPVNATAPFKPLRTVAVSPDGRRIATGGEAGLQLWDDKGRLLASAPAAQAGRVASVTFRSNLLASGGEDGIIRLWNLNGREAAEPLRGHRGAVLDISFDPKRDRLASAGQDGTVRLWDLRGKSWTVVSRHDGPVNAVAFAPDGKLLVTGGRDGTAVIWYPEEGLPHTILSGHQGEVTSVAFSPNGRFLATGSLDRTVRVWTVQGTLALVMHGHKEGVRDVAFDASGALLASASGETLSRQANRDSTIRLWDIGPPLAASADQSEFTAVAYSPDGTQIATVTRAFDFPPQSELVLRNVQGRPISPPLRGHESSISAMAFSRDGRLIASADHDGTVRLWDSRGRPLLPLTRATVPVTALVFGRDQLLATGTPDGTIRIWDAGHRHMYRSWQAHSKVVNALAFSPDGSLLASASDDDSVRLWNRDGREVRATLRGHTNDVTALAFNPNGRVLASGSRDGTIRLWRISRKVEGQRFEGHIGVVTGIAFSPDGKLIASVGEDGTLRFWDAEGTPVGNPIVAHARYVEALAFSPAGDVLLTAGRDGLLRTWPARDDVWLEAACRRLRWHPSMLESMRTGGALARVCHDLPATDTKDETNLLRAAMKGDVRRVRELLSAGQPVDGPVQEGETSMLAATRLGQAETVQLLLARGADARQPNIDGETPLHVAARTGNTDVLQLLVRAGTDLEARSHRGDTPLLVAARAGWPEAVGLLLRYGANAQARDAYGRSAVAVAALGANRGKLMNRLIEAGAAPEGIETAGETADDLPTPSAEVPRSLDAESKSCLAKQEQGSPLTAVVQCFQAAAYHGSAFAQYELGRAFERGRGVTQNFVSAAHWYRRAASARQPAALRSLALCYRTGRGVAQDVGRAFILLRQAAELGEVRAQLDLGLCLLDLDCAPAADFVAAADWIRLAAENGMDSAQLELGKLYELGHGVPPSRSLAAHWYRRAADQRNPTAMLYLGWLSETDFGSPSSGAEALRWYRAAAEYGSTDAQRKLAWLYAKGILVKPSLDLALEWYRKAADGGNCAAQIELGRILEARGELKAAEQLYNSAKEAGSTWAPRKLDKSLWATAPRELVYSPCR